MHCCAKDFKLAVNSAARLTCFTADGRSWCHTPTAAALSPSATAAHRKQTWACSLLLLKLQSLLFLLLLPLLLPQQTALFALLSPLALALGALCSLCLQPQQSTRVPHPGALALASSVASQNDAYAPKQVLLVQRSAWLPPVIPQQTGLMQQPRALPLMASTSRHCIRSDRQLTQAGWGLSSQQHTCAAARSASSSSFALSLLLSSWGHSSPGCRPASCRRHAISLSSKPFLKAGALTRALGISYCLPFLICMSS